MYKHILIATDGSDLSGQAIEHGITLAKSVGARVTVLTVSEPFYASACVGGAEATKASRRLHRTLNS